MFRLIKSSPVPCLAGNRGVVVVRGGGALLLHGLWFSYKGSDAAAAFHVVACPPPAERGRLGGTGGGIGLGVDDGLLRRSDSLCFLRKDESLAFWPACVAIL